MKHTGHAVAKMFKDFGVEYIFGMPGLQNYSLYDGIQALGPDLRHILVRDERSAGFAADAYARLTGKVGVCDAFAGPGSTKFLDALGEALNNSIPLVAIVGDAPRDLEALKELGVVSQGIDQAGYLKPVTKAVYTVPTKVALPHLIRSAFRTATSNRPGPVAIIIPQDIIDSPWEEGDEALAVDSNYQSVPSHRIRPASTELQEAVEIITASEKPVIIAGGGVMLSKAEAALAEFAHKINASVVTSLTGKGAFSDEDPLSAGVLCPLGPASAEDITRSSDCVILVGTKCSQNTTLNWSIPSKEQVTIHIDIDSCQLGRTFRPAKCLQGDASATLEALTEFLPIQPERNAWLKEIKEKKDKEKETKQKVLSTEEGVIKPQAVMTELAKLIQPKDIVISDASFSAGWISTYLPCKEPGRKFLFARGLGSMGYALPASIGASCIKEPDSRVITVNGDASFCFGISELATLNHFNLKATHIILNNGSLGWVKYIQKMHYGSRFMSSDVPNIDFAAVAKGFGCIGITVENLEELPEALERALDSDVPAVLDIRCALWETPIRSYENKVKSENLKDEPPGAKYTMKPWFESPKEYLKYTNN